MMLREKGIQEDLHKKEITAARERERQLEEQVRSLTASIKDSQTTLGQPEELNRSVHTYVANLLHSLTVMLGGRSESYG